MFVAEWFSNIHTWLSKGVSCKFVCQYHAIIMQKRSRKQFSTKGKMTEQKQQRQEKKRNSKKRKKTTHKSRRQRQWQWQCVQSAKTPKLITFWCVITYAKHDPKQQDYVAKISNIYPKHIYMQHIDIQSTGTKLSCSIFIPIFICKFTLSPSFAVEKYLINAITSIFANIETHTQMLADMFSKRKVQLFAIAEPDISISSKCEQKE